MTEAIATSDALDALVSSLEREPVLGLDTEFLRERTYHPQLALVQLRWASGSALVDPLAVDVRGLAPLLSAPRLFVIHAAAQDLEILEHHVGCVPSRLFDPQIAAGFLGYRSPSLDTLVREIVGEELSKSDQLTDWTRRPLTESQRRYALSDVEHLLELHRVLTERLEARGRLEWVREECERFLRRDRRRADPETLWWRLKGQKKLSRRAAAVAQRLTAFREHEAARLDIPSRFVLSDMAILAMAHRPPTTAAQVRSARGLEGGRLTNERVDAILAAVEEGLALPPERQKLPPTQGARERPAPGIVSLCVAWTAQRAEDEDLDPALLATRDEIEAFASGERTRIASGFRHAIVGQDLERILAGEAAVAAGRDGKLRLVAC